MNELVAVLLVIVVVLCVAAAAAFSAARAKSRLAEVRREMELTWKAIAAAQLALDVGDATRANRALDEAALIIGASQSKRARRRHVTRSWHA